MKRLVPIVAIFSATAAFGKKPQQAESQTAPDEPHAIGKLVTTTTIRRCPDGYEPITRYNGQHACAKDLIPLNEPADGFIR